jgi:hypothetical protein
MIGFFMADRTISGVPHSCDKTHSLGQCSKCPKRGGIGWKIHKRDSLYVGTLVAEYCYDCTKNMWQVAFRLYRESLAE